MKVWARVRPSIRLFPLEDFKAIPGGTDRKEVCPAETERAGGRLGGGLVIANNGRRHDYMTILQWTCSITRLVIEQVLQNAPHFAIFKLL
jgi:hypothetical protein